MEVGLSVITVPRGAEIYKSRQLGLLITCVDIMSNQLSINIAVGDGEESQDDLDDIEEGGSLCGDRDRTSFGTNLNAGLKEKLKTISAKRDGVSMADLVNAAVRKLVESLEEKNGEYEVPEVFKVEDA